MNNETLISLFKDMLYIRLVEEKICDIYSEQEMRCPVHVSIGQEGTAVGICSTLTKDDYVFSNHRCHGHYLAKGGDLKKFFAELYGRATGCTGGRGGSMHLLDIGVGFMGATPIVSSTIPIAVGTAFAAVMRGDKKVVVSFFGEATTEEGTFHESVNFAKLKNLPVIFFCENNMYSVYTPTKDRQPNRKIIDIMRANGLICYEADGNDVVNLHKICKEAVEKVRSGQGPIFIEASTYRWREHCGPNYDNHIGYRTVEEFLEWKEKDPIKKIEGMLLNLGYLDEAKINEFKNEINQKIDEAIEYAKSSPYPDKEELGKYIYAD